MSKLQQLLSEAQKPALNLKDSSLIAAGAGAGKTRTLAAMVVQDLQNQIKPEDIVVCTFTKAAALNLRSRIAQTLIKIDSNPILSEKILIGTIDAISSRILRERSLLANLPPDFTIADQRLLAQLQEQAFARALEDLSLKMRSELFTHWDPDGASLQKTVIDSLEFLRGRNLPLPSMPVRKTALPPIKASVAMLDGLAPKIRGMVEKDIQLANSQEIKGWSSRKYNQRRDLEEWPELVAALERHYWYLKNEQTLPMRQAFIQLLTYFASHYQRTKQNHHCLDFLGLNEQLLNLAAQNLQPQYRRLYLDEAQDTSPLQLNTLKKLIVPTGCLYLFGDANQSIYRFRGADIDNFRQMAQTLDTDVTLNENWRSTEDIINFVNHLASTHEDLMDDAVIMESGANKGQAKAVAWYELTDNSLSVHGQPPAHAEALLALDKITEHQASLNLTRKDVCVLARSNTIAQTYAKVFRQNGVPVQLIQRVGLWKTEEARDLKAYLTVLANIEDAAGWLRVLTGRFGRQNPLAVSSIFEKLETDTLSELIRHYLPEFWQKHQAVLNNHSAINALKQALVEHDYDLALSLDDQTGSRWRNIELMIDELHHLAKQESVVSPVALLELWQEALDAGWDLGQAKPDPELDAITIMTVHQSKGDEFPLTVIARLNQNAQADKKTIWLDEQGMVGAIIERGADLTAQGAKEQSKVAQQAESARLLYVALTRAEQGLLLFSSTGSAGKSGEPKRVGWAKTLYEISKTTSKENWKPVSVDAKQVRRKTSNGSILVQSPLAPVINNKEKLDILPQRTNISFSQLSSWAKCGLRKEMEGCWARELPTGFALPQVTSSGGNRQRGEEFHKALASCDWRTHNPDWHPSLIQQGPDWLNLLRSELPLRVKPACKEKTFLLPIGEYIFRGVIDHGIKTSANSWLIYDWKTGDNPHDSIYQYQAKLYALAILNLPSRPQTITTTWWNLPLNEQVVNIYQQQDVERLTQDLLSWTADVLSQPPIAASSKFQSFCLDCPGCQLGCPVAEDLNLTS